MPKTIVRKFVFNGNNKNNPVSIKGEVNKTCSIYTRNGRANLLVEGLSFFSYFRLNLSIKLTISISLRLRKINYRITSSFCVDPESSFT